jgi:hypothetical protein|tara:strand:- start:66 stop:206 length:141 start_codon:yes stop_codon:yes gene_type:complete
MIRNKKEIKRELLLRSEIEKCLQNKILLENKIRFLKKELKTSGKNK